MALKEKRGKECIQEKKIRRIGRKQASEKPTAKATNHLLELANEDNLSSWRR
jgi:hypothetical protein